MDETQDVRRTGRRRVRPVEFWNFEKAEDISDSVVYNEYELTRKSVFEPLSLKYKNTSVSAKNKNQSVKLAVKKSKSLSENINKSETIKPRGRKEKNKKTPNQTKTSTVVNGEASSWLSRQEGKKRKAAKQGPSGTDAAHPVGSLRGANKKLKHSGEQECIGNDEGYSTLSEGGSVASQRIAGRRRSSGNKELLKQKREKVRNPGSKNTTRKKEGDKNDCVDNKQEEGSTTPPNSHSKFQGSITSTSDWQGNKTSYMAMLNLLEKDITQNSTTNTTLEQPSFRNILTSTVLDAPGKPMFRVPRIPPLKRNQSSVHKVSMQKLDPSMVTIPEERDEDKGISGEKRQEGGNINGDKQPEERGIKGEEKKYDLNEDEQLKKTGINAEKKHKNPNSQQETQQSEAQNLPQESQHLVNGASVPASTKSGDAKTGPSAIASVEQQDHTQGMDQRGQDKTVSQDNLRRSFRVRTKRLEFWNFEKVKVQRKDNGEVQIIHEKQDSTAHIQSRVVDCSSVLVHPRQGFTLSDKLLSVTSNPQTQRNKKGKVWTSPKNSQEIDSTRIHPAVNPGKKRMDTQNRIVSWSPDGRRIKSPIKRKLFSPGDNFYAEPVEEERKMRFRVGDKILKVSAVINISDLQFVVLNKKDYKCYLGNAVQNKERGVYVSYLYLERGEIVWNSSRQLSVLVLEGSGKLKVVNRDEKKVYTLKSKVAVHGIQASKICLKKDGRCRMLRLHLTWRDTGGGAG